MLHQDWCRSERGPVGGLLWELSGAGTPPKKCFVEHSTLLQGVPVSPEQVLCVFTLCPRICNTLDKAFSALPASVSAPLEGLGLA